MISAFFLLYNPPSHTSCPFPLTHLDSFLTHLESSQYSGQSCCVLANQKHIFSRTPSLLLFPLSIPPSVTIIFLFAKCSWPYKHVHYTVIKSHTHSLFLRSKTMSEIFHWKTAVDKKRIVTCGGFGKKTTTQHLNPHFQWHLKVCVSQFLNFSFISTQLSKHRAWNVSFVPIIATVTKESHFSLFSL